MKSPSSNHNLIKLVIKAKPSPGREKRKEKKIGRKAYYPRANVTTSIKDFKLIPAGHSVFQWSLTGNTTEKVTETVSR